MSWRKLAHINWKKQAEQNMLMTYNIVDDIIIII